MYPSLFLFHRVALLPPYSLNHYATLFSCHLRPSTDSFLYPHHTTLYDILSIASFLSSLLIVSLLCLLQSFIFKNTLASHLEFPSPHSHQPQHTD